jgi:hypothetical protein
MGKVEIDLEGVQGEGLPGDALGIVADTLEFLIYLDGGVNKSQGTSDRLLSHKEFQTETIHFLFEVVNFLVTKNHGVGEGPFPLK